MSAAEAGDVSGVLEIALEAVANRLIQSIEDREVDEDLWEGYKRAAEALGE